MKVTQTTYTALAAAKAVNGAIDIVLADGTVCLLIQGRLIVAPSVENVE